uniref:Uncharacterized protein n=2 Tax=Nothobranchius TaxID=28779 RepID=A0A1A8UJN4_NOTFU
MWMVSSNPQMLNIHSVQINCSVVKEVRTSLPHVACRRLVFPTRTRPALVAQQWSSVVKDDTSRKQPLAVSDPCIKGASCWDHEEVLAASVDLNKRCQSSTCHLTPLFLIEGSESFLSSMRCE